MAEVASDIADKVSDTMYQQWDKICDYFEEKGGPSGKWVSQNVLRRLSIEAPVVVTFVFICVTLHILNMTIMPGISFYLAIPDYFSPFSPLQYVRLITHTFGHDGLAHIKGNMINLLLVGPSAEFGFGSWELLSIFGLVAITSGIAHIWVGGTNTRQLGASGICFSMVLLNSLVCAKSGKIPISFLFTAFLWISDEVWRFFFSGDGVSHHAHLVGAFIGTAAGFYIHTQKEKERLKKVTSKWASYAKAKKG